MVIVLIISPDFTHSSSVPTNMLLMRFRGKANPRDEIPWLLLSFGVNTNNFQLLILQEKTSFYEVPFISFAMRNWNKTPFKTAEICPCDIWQQPFCRSFFSQHSNRVPELNHILPTFSLISLWFISVWQNVSILLHPTHSKYIIYQIKKIIINWSKGVWLPKFKIGIMPVYIWEILLMFFKILNFQRN